MKVHIQILDAISGKVQSGCIEQPVEKGFEVRHALATFGEEVTAVDWTTLSFPSKHEKMSNSTVYVGQIEGTAKIVTVVTMD